MKWPGRNRVTVLYSAVMGPVLRNTIDRPYFVSRLLTRENQVHHVAFVLSIKKRAFRPPHGGVTVGGAREMIQFRDWLVVNFGRSSVCTGRYLLLLPIKTSKMPGLDSCCIN